MFRDRLLELELAEHALLVALGWTWGAADGEFFWMAPPTHKGSSTYYQSRGHAINSVKRWSINMEPTRSPRRYSNDSAAESAEIQTQLNSLASALGVLP